MKYLIAALIAFSAIGAKADHDVRAASDRGTYAETLSVAGSSVAGTAFASSALKRMDGVYFNNSAFIIWIGTTTATENNKQHSNILMGFPIFSSQTFRLDGSMTGSLAFTCDAGVSACQVRKLEGSNR